MTRWTWGTIPDERRQNLDSINPAEARTESLDDRNIVDGKQDRRFALRTVDMLRATPSWEPQNSHACSIRAPCRRRCSCLRRRNRQRSTCGGVSSQNVLNYVTIPNVASTRCRTWVY